MWKPDICIHHFPCDDGFAAAWVVNQKWPGEVEFRGTNYGRAIPDDAIDGKNILISDFSFKPDILRAMAARAKTIILLDHHKTAEADLAGFPLRIVGARFDAAQRMFDHVTGPDMNIAVSFDMERSGAMMTWQFCFPDHTANPLIKFVQDRDLWRMAFPETRAMSLYLRSWPYDFGVWSQIAEYAENELESLIAEAKGIERFYDRKLDELVPTAVRWPVIAGDKVPALNVPWAFASDAADRLLKEYPEAPFAVAYFENGDGKTFSLRSRDDRRDVSEVARQYGGGGHRNAAGFRMPA